MSAHKKFCRSLALPRRSRGSVIALTKRKINSGGNAKTLHDLAFRDFGTYRVQHAANKR